MGKFDTSFKPAGRKRSVTANRVELEGAPLNREGRLFLPARYVAEALGYRVTWYPTRQQVLVTLTT